MNTVSQGLAETLSQSASTTDRTTVQEIVELLLQGVDPEMLVKEGIDPQLIIQAINILEEQLMTTEDVSAPTQESTGLAQMMAQA